MQGFHEPQSADTNLHEEPRTSVLLPAMARLGSPVLLFGVSFLFLVWVITLLTSPDRFPVHTGDAIVQLQDLESRARLLEEQKATLEHTRQQFQTKEKAPVLTQVTSISDAIVPLGDVLLSIEEARRAFAQSSSDPIALPRMQYTENTLILGGDVRDRSGRSMQILASFVDSIRQIPAVTTVTEPEYVSHPMPDGGTASPFVLTLTLRRA